MGTSAFQFGLEQAEQRRARREAVQDEERRAQLANIANAGLTPEAQRDAIQQLYAKDPSALKQHIENLAGRLVGRKPQPTPMAYAPQSVTTQAPPIQAGGTTLPASAPVTVSTPGARTHSERLQQDLAGGKSEAQQKTDAYQTQTNIANKGRLDLNQQETQQKQQAVTDLITKYVPKEQQQKALQDYAERAAGIQGPRTLKEYSSPDGKQRNWFTPGEEPPGWNASQGGTGAPKPSQAALATYLRAKYGDNPTAEQIEEGTRKHQQLMSGLTVGSHQTVAYDNDGIPHVITLSTSSRKDFGGGASDGGPSKGPAPKKTAAPSQPKPNQLDFRKATPQSTAAKKAVDTAENSFLDVQKASTDPTPVGDQGVILAWLRGRVNRVTATEIAAVNNLGGAKMKIEGDIVRIESGKMTDQQRAWFLRSAKDNYDNAQTVAGKYGKPAPKADSQQGGGKSLADRLNEALQ